MVVINLNISYKLKMIDREGKPIEVKNRDVSEGLIASAVGANFERSMPKTDSRIWSKLQDTLFEATDTIEVEETVFDWLVRQLDKWEPPAAFASRYWTFVQELEKLKPKS